MKLHRLVLRNYRGIAFRDIQFPDRGVVVVSGANEIGKSSMIEALDLLLEAKDRSSKKEVKQVKPTHLDEGAEVTAEISTGPYRFTYFKRYHKRPVTELTVTAPAREQWTGDEAHDRVRAIMRETVDVDLWQAQRVLQSAATAPVDLSGSDALSRALDVAAGQSDELSGAEPLLVDRIEVEFRQYFTATGRSTGDLAAAVKRRADAAAVVAECEAAVAEIDDAVARHEQLTAGLARVAIDRTVAARRLEAAEQAADVVRLLVERSERAHVVADAARSTHAAAVAAHAERARLRTEVDDVAAELSALEPAVHAAAQDEVSAREANATAAAVLSAASAELAAGQAAMDAARAVVDRVSRRDEATRLADQLARVDKADALLRDVDAELAEQSLTDLSMRLIDAASAAVDVAVAAADAASARIELVAVADVELAVGGERITLNAGEQWTTSATAPTDVELPALRVRVVPGAPAADTGDVLDTKRAVLAQVLGDAGVSDLEAARALHERRRELTAMRDRLLATRDAVVCDADVTELRARLAELRSEAFDDCPADAGAARAELSAAASALRSVATAQETARTAASAAERAVTEKVAAATVLGGRLDAARTRLAAAAERLAQQRALVADDDLKARAEEASRRAVESTAQSEAVAAELALATPDAVTAELGEATTLAAALAERHRELAEHLVATNARLTVYNGEGRRSRLDAALLARRHADSDWARLQRRADAVAMLREVMTRHRDEARQRYVDPFRIEVERLGRIVFGPDFEVELDAQLRIQSRTLDGCTVPYDSLSGGAKEQLGIVARLAGAALVAKEDGVPVVIDDALGFSDASRLAGMGEVFNAVSGDGQVIVLTCSPERYAGVGDAHHVELGATS